LLRWSRRRRAAVGAEALIGQTAVVATPTQVRVAGELWEARAERRLAPGEEVVVVAVDGLTLVVGDR
jgi:membrane protein implicated in regulation of membrane protease activity